jgi:hypothetical protein
MAWPSTPLTTYSAGIAPAIQAFDLNAFQSAINGIVNGTYSLAAVVADGSGGAVVVPVPGTTKVSANLTETTLPGTARSKGTDCIGTRLWGWVHFRGGRRQTSLQPQGIYSHRDGQLHGGVSWCACRP